MSFYAKFTHFLFLLFQFVLIVLLVAGFATFLGVLFIGNVEGDVTSLLNLPGKSETLKFVGIAMGGILVALQALATQRRAQAVEDTVAHAEEGQRQERMKNAIEHLGHTSESVRLGGAYELFHLARDTTSPVKAIPLQQTVLDILCSHIRHTTGEIGYREKHTTKPSQEVQGILDLLFKNGTEIFDGLHINLDGSWLNGASLAYANLTEANMCEAHLEGANLSGAKLNGAMLYCTQMRGVYLGKAELNGVHAYEVRLQGADLGQSQLRGAVVLYAQMQGVNLASAQLQGTILVDVNLQGASLEHAQLQGLQCEVNLDRSYSQQMRHAIERKSDLSSVIFEGGMSQNDVDSFLNDFPREEADGILYKEDELQQKEVELRKKIQSHIGRQASHELPKDSGAIVGSYTEEEAEKWIAEYEEAMGEASENEG